MKPNNFPTSRNVKLKFVGIYIVTVVLMGVIFLSLWTTLGKKEIFPLKSSHKESTITERKILIADELLHSKIHRLQLLYQQYIKIASDSTSLLNLDSLHAVITNSEDFLKATIDSLDFESGKYEMPTQMEFKNMLTSFRSILQNGRLMHSLNAEMTNSTDTFSTEDQAMLSLQQQLIEKELRIADLEAQIRQGSTSYASYTVAPSSEQIDQKEEEDYLKSALTAEKIKNEDLTSNISSLKKENENLTTQLSELRKSSTSSEVNNYTLKNRISSLEKQIEELNLSLRFAKVDCNLSRADAQQIISSARQRKDLLTEALRALNDLTKSKDVAIQARAKDKMNELNRIATTLRD